MEIPKNRSYFLFHLRCLHEHYSHLYLLGVGDNLSLCNPTQNHIKEIFGEVLLFHHKSSLNIYLLHHVDNFIGMDILWLSLCRKVGVFHPLYYLQHIFLLLWTLHLLWHDQVSHCPHRKRGLWILLLKVRLHAQKYSLSRVRCNYFYILAHWTLVCKALV